jgi:hypothetical protein
MFRCIYMYISNTQISLSLSIYTYIYIYVACILYISTLYNIYIIIIYPILYMSYSWITKSTWPGRPPSTPCPAPAVLGWAAPGSAPNYYGSCAGSHRCNRLHINKAITSYPATIYIYIYWFMHKYIYIYSFKLIYIYSRILYLLAKIM